MSADDLRVEQLLRDIDASARRIIDRLRDVTRDEFVHPNSLDIQDIVSRRLSIIGEAAWRSDDGAAIRKSVPVSF